MNYSKYFLEKIFSEARMKKYFALYPNDESKAITHYECNILLSESFYPSMSTLEVALRNALSRELQTFAGRKDWYNAFSTTSGLTDLDRYISQSRRLIAARGETENPDKITAELALGFWTSLLNRNYERILWKDLRRAFPYMPKNYVKEKTLLHISIGFDICVTVLTITNLYVGILVVLKIYMKIYCK